jgi:hypothetical protein
MKKKPERITYKTRPIRLSDEVWDKLKASKIKSGKSWNLFISEVNKKC